MTAEERDSKVGSLIEAEGTKVEEREFHSGQVQQLLEEELGEDWLAYKPRYVRIFVQTMRLFGAMASLYFFLIALSLMGDGLTALTGKTSGGLFGGSNNPLIGLMIGIMATVLVQSSSTVTSILVVLVSNEIIDLQTAIPMVMGANIGTSVTNTIVSLGFVENTDDFQRGFAGATVHDMFNFLNVLVLLPLEIIVSAINGGNGGIIQMISEALAENRGEKELEGGDEFSDANPIKKITNPILDKMIQINSGVIADYAQGFPALPEDTENCNIFFSFEDENTEMDTKGCPEFFCDFCPGGVFDQTLYETANEAFDNEKLIEGGHFEKYGDTGGGFAVLFISLVMLIGSLATIVQFLVAIVRGSAQKLLVQALNNDYAGGGYVSILVGCVLTFIVQSSSITTSILTPLVAIGALSLDNMFPYTLGANIGTTGTGLIAAAAEGTVLAYSIALVHFFFNLFGAIIWYPWPVMRNIPLQAARNLGSMAALWKIIPLLYLFLAFIFYPLMLFAFSEGFEGSTGGKVASSFALIIFIVAHGYAFFWYHRLDGRAKVLIFIEKRKERVEEIKQSKIGTVTSRHKTIEL